MITLLYPVSPACRSRQPAFLRKFSGQRALATFLGGGLLLSTPQVGVAQTLYQVNGQAAMSTICSPNGFMITPDQGSAGGSVWRRQQLTLANSFVVTSSVYLGTKDANGADGLTFTLQRSAAGVGAIGNAGQNLGVSGIVPAVSVEIDTFDNGAGAYDIADDHLAIFKNASINNTVAFTTPAGSTATAIAAAVDVNGTGLNIENGAYYPFKVAWNAKTKTLRVYFNNVLRATYTEDISSTVFNNNPLIYWGFTGSTGGYSNQQEVCALLLDYDQDADNLADREDIDDDTDGLLDLLESNTADATGDADNDGVPNYQDPDFGTLNTKGVVSTLDADGDGQINQFDLDSDSDGLPDVLEGTDGKMSSGFTASYSAATGQYRSAVDAAGWPISAVMYTMLPDTDGDGLADYLDMNADGDWAPDWIEGFDDNSNGISADDFAARGRAFVAAGGSASLYPNTDADNNGTSDWLDDANSNGIPNYLDNTSSFYHDTDEDGLVDLLDASNFGIGYAEVSSYPDYNQNAVPDYRDATVVTPLPVTLVTFTAQIAGAAVHVRWVTASEENAYHFEVERSQDGLVFTSLATLPAAGTSSATHYYAYDDKESPKAGASVYYRLRSFDVDGRNTYSPVRPISGTTELVLSPNPTTGTLTLMGAAPAAPVQIWDKLGRIVSSALTDTSGKLIFVLPTTLPSGLYLLRTDGQTLRFVLE